MMIRFDRIEPELAEETLISLTVSGAERGDLVSGRYEFHEAYFGQLMCACDRELLVLNHADDDGASLYVATIG